MLGSHAHQHRRVEPPALTDATVARNVNIDLFIAQNEGAWLRLESLTASARRGGLKAAEVDEFLGLYQRVSTHLSQARDHLRDGPITVRLTRLVAEANAALYRSRRGSTSGLRDFLSITFPAAVWTSRRFIAASAALLVVPAILVGIWVAVSPAAVEIAGPASFREAYVEDEFEDYYSQSHAAQFSTEVTVNNIQVSFMAFVGGAVLCIPGAFILLFNGVNLGVAGGLFGSAGQLDKFFGLILPHGLLEMSAIAIAGGAGLRVGWSIIAPGDLRRGEAAMLEARRSVAVIIGLVGAFTVAGLIEAFVTPSGLPTILRVGIGATIELLFVVWMVANGRAAEAMGATGIMGELDRRITTTPGAPIRAVLSP